MKKLLLLFYFMVCLGAKDFYILTQEVIKINKASRNQTSTQALIKASQKKDKLMAEIIQSILKKEIESLENLNVAISELEDILSDTIQNPYSSALNSLKLQELIAKQTLIQCAQTLAERNHFFTTHVQVRGEINRALSKIIQGSKNPQESEIGGLNPQELANYKTKQQEFEIIVGSYAEILNYLKSNLDLLLPDSLWSSFDFATILDQTTKILPSQIQYPAVTKGAFSLGIFIFFFLLRHLLARILIKSISMLSRFLENKTIQEQIKEQIASPILWIILIVSSSLALDILAFPNPVSPKIKVWINASLIISLSWLTILLFKGYGIAILGNIAQRNNSFRREVINLLLKVIYFFIVVIAILVLLKNFGFNVSALIASLGIGGLAVAFAVKDVLANFFASVVLLFDNSFNQGDWIVCGDIEGTVVEVGLRRTTIRTFDNAMLFVPNSLLANGSVKNWSRRKMGRRIRMQIGITYSSTPEQIRACVRDIQLMLLSHPKIAKADDEKHPLSHYELDLKSNIISIDDLLGYKSNLFVVLDEFAGSSINILVYCFSKTTIWGEWLEVRQDVMLKIMEILDKHGLGFAFPSQSLYIEKMPTQA
ncbi:mechanosensitive ion channel family protein [Helicobacter pametensis]|uniref:mechanosensitive ion channel family protein n=1 Tax=Helicobacter pametensis TaxID=95149 RepID=UPI00047FED10|nr:mechanosensitive ion channel family protein [Helicobacter pametensis]